MDRRGDTLARGGAARYTQPASLTRVRCSGPRPCAEPLWLSEPRCRHGHAPRHPSPLQPHAHPPELPPPLPPRTLPRAIPGRGTPSTTSAIATPAPLAPDPTVPSPPRSREPREPRALLCRYLAEPLDTRIPKINLTTRQAELLRGKLILVSVDLWDAGPPRSGNPCSCLPTGAREGKSAVFAVLVAPCIHAYSAQYRNPALRLRIPRVGGPSLPDRALRAHPRGCRRQGGRVGGRLGRAPLLAVSRARP